MNTFSINTFGCKVNQYESQQIRQFLEQLGLTHIETSKRSDLVVVNTCCVTQSASAKSRRYIRKAQKLNPDAVIIVAGCLPTVQTGELDNPGKNVRLISHQQVTAAILSQAVNGKLAAVTHRQHRNTSIKTESNPKIKCKSSSNQPQRPLLTSFKDHTRAFLKIQDGCDGHCSYCIIPKTRPVVRSKPAEMVVQEAQQLVESGHKEIVVTGVCLGAYGQASVRRKKRADQENDKLAELLDKLAEIPNLARIRISSLEPGDVTDKLLDAFCNHRNIMPHLHLSLQSGSNAILKKMCRQYTAEEFKEKVELIKCRLDRPAITADIIVGFPGETERDFEATVETAKEAGFGKMHIFKFSKRAGTAAANLQGAVDNKVIKMRSQILRDLDVELGHKFRQQFIGETDAVLVENGDGQVYGHSKRYFRVYPENNKAGWEKNTLMRVKLVENKKDGMVGIIEK